MVSVALSEDGGCGNGVGGVVLDGLLMCGGWRW